MSAEPDPNVGRVLEGRYRLAEPIGKGGMGAVYRAVHMDLDKAFAVKLLRPEVARTEEAARRFEREAEAMSRLRHPGCVNVTDFGRADDGSPFLVMEYLEGDSLGALLAAGERLPPGEAVHIACQILEAAQAAHELGIVHRDLKPENVMVGRFGVKILDFGIAKILEAGESGITDAQAVFGTPEYLSPEQALGEPADARADLYAVGVMLYEMLSGARPFTGPKMEVIGQHLTREPPPLAPSLAPFSAVVRRALAKRREDRFQSAHEFLTALRAVTTPAAQAAPAPAEPPEPELPRIGHEKTKPLGSTDPAAPALAPSRPSRRRRLVTMAAAVLALGAAASAIGVFVVATRPASPSPRASALDLARLSLRAARDPHAARGEAERLARAHPRDAAIFLQLGHLLFIGKDAEPARAMAAYREAIRLDPALVDADPRVVEHLGETFGDSLHGEEAFLLAETLGAIAGDAIVDFARKARAPGALRRALRAAENVGVANRLDRVALFGSLLETAPGCDDRREIVLHLKATGDPRALPHLEKALARRAGFRDLEEPNACIANELREAIDAIRAPSK